MNLLAMALSLFVSNYTTTFNCGFNPYFVVNSQELNPAYPKPGDVLSWTVNYTVTDYIEVMSPRNVFYGVKNDLVTIEPMEYDLCEEITCPLTVGEYSHTNYIIWPKSYSGKLSLTSEWLDEYDNELMCNQMIHFT